MAFAVCTGAATFILALGAGAAVHDWAGALILAIVCGAMSWAAAARATAGYAEALDRLIARMAEAAEGDLTSSAPSQVQAVLPALAHSLDGLLARVRTNLDTVNSLAMIDSVTQLPNRICFRRDAARILDDLPDDAPAALYFIDLDRFKEVNDTFGHAQGDQLLAMVAQRLRAIAASIDSPSPFIRDPLVARLAGDEFTMLVPDLTSTEEAKRIGDALLDTLSEPYELLGQFVDVGASIGVAIRPDQGRSVTDLMRAADIAMYHAKDSGRAQCQLFTPSLAARLADNLRLEEELRSAIDGREFTFVYQPQLALADGKVIGAEALLRWRHPRLGLLAPDSFLARAEQSGLVNELGYWAVEELAEVIGRWHACGMGLRVGANISLRQLGRPNFFGQIRSAMESHAAPATMLEIEILEELAFRCDDAALAGLAYWREQGASIAIDGFGGGASDLSRLRDLPIDRLKIHRALVADLVPSAKARTVVQAIIGLAHGLGCRVTAEGVETPAQRTLLEVAGCDAVQGVAIARPMEEAELFRWLERRETIRLSA